MLKPSPDDVRKQLKRILEHPAFAASRQRRKLLSYVVEESLSGRADRLKGVAIAISVFGRNEDFDQRTDPVVRLEARRLRQDLDSYYADAGIDDPIRISIPKGGYAPVFTRLQHSARVEAETGSPTSRKIERKAGFVTLATSVCALIVGIWVGSQSIFDAATRPTLPTVEEFPSGPVIAVLPVQVFDDSSRLFADGMTQQLTSELVRFQDLWVLPLGAVNQFRDGSASPQILRTVLGADYALEGTLVENSDGLELTARLVDLKSERYTWVMTLDMGPDPSDVYAAQDEIVNEIVGNIAGKYGLILEAKLSEARRSPPQTRDAYDCVLSYYGYQIRINLEEHQEILSCIEKSVSLDPEYAEAWAILSNLYVQQVRFGLTDDTSGAISEARFAAERAVELDPRSSFAQLMLANLSFAIGEIEEFRAASERALSLNPNDVSVLGHFGLRLVFLGEWESGLALTEKAMELSPVHPRWFHFPSAFRSFTEADYERALLKANKVDMPAFFWDPLLRAAIHGKLGNEAEASNAAKQLLSLKPDFANEADDFLDIWQIEPGFRRKLVEGLELAGLYGVK
ncbi:MAG: hypothetical protein AAGA38_11105 [Pseudomonadota bacterium]